MRTKTGTGVYDIRFVCSVAGVQVSINMKIADFATYAQTSNPLVVTTVNAPRVIQDTAFDLFITN